MYVKIIWPTGYESLYQCWSYTFLPDETSIHLDPDCALDLPPGTSVFVMGESGKTINVHHIPK